MDSEILLAQPRGFCAGVDRAIEIVERALQQFSLDVDSARERRIDDLLRRALLVGVDRPEIGFAHLRININLLDVSVLSVLRGFFWHLFLFKWEFRHKKDTKD